MMMTTRLPKKNVKTKKGGKKIEDKGQQWREN
jgi:hypothetical protein